MSKKLNKSTLIKSIRHFEDKPRSSNEDTYKSSQSQVFSKVKNSFLMNHLLVNEKIVPQIYKIIEACLSSLNLEDKKDKLSVFIYNDSKLNAQCFSGLGENIIITLSSSIIKFFTEDELKFVIGHELGHYIFHSGLNKKKKYFRRFYE